jgi:hypothetical protein
MTVNFSGADVQSIEEALEKHRPGQWRRLGAAALEQHSALMPRAGWQLDVPAGQFACSSVDRLLLLIDHAFPKSEPRVVSSSLQIGSWPHVESNSGVLCLRRTLWSASAGDRAVATIADAGALLDFDAARRKVEFDREFAAYWGYLVSAGGPTFMTLTAPQPQSREIHFAKCRNGSRVLLGDDRRVLQSWLEHSGESVKPQDIGKTKLIWLPEPWSPAEFPSRVQDVINRTERGALNAYLRAGESLPVLFGASTASGPVFVGVEVPGGSRQRFRNGFRPNHVPGAAVAMFSASLPVVRCRVERVDAAWVHGRDHNDQQTTLAAKRVGIVGCGSLGAAVARLLAQMGIGNFILVDLDALSSANTSRHVLGSEFVRENKAAATRRMLLRDFPHLTEVECFDKRFQHLPEANLKRLEECDVIISAGIDTTGDAALDQWRSVLTTSPVHVCTWVEEYALAGHAIALFAGDALFDGFSTDGDPTFCLTQWPPDAQTRIVEAGCGNSFQPHGVIELYNSVSMVAKLALDVLTGDVTRSCRRAWLGDRDRLVDLGGRPAAEFSVSNTIKIFAWPNGVP